MRMLGFTIAVTLLGGVAAAEAPAAPPAKVYRGRVMTIEVSRGRVVDLLQAIADVGMISIVPLGVASDAVVDVRAQGEPWDQVLDRVVSAAGLEVTRRGGVFLVGAPARIAPLAQAKPVRYRGPRISLELRDAAPAAAAQLLAVGGGAPFELAASTTPVRLRLRNVPLDQAQELLGGQAGAAPVPRPGKVAPPPKGTCAAADVAVGELVLRGILQRGAIRHALLASDTEAVVVTRGGCVGADRATITAIRPNAIELTARSGVASTVALGDAGPGAEPFGAGGLGFRAGGSTTGTSPPEGLGLGRRPSPDPAPRFEFMTTTASAGLDRDIIRRVVRRDQLKLVYCYEKALAAQPTLAGALAIAFTITADGAVTDASATGMGDELGACVTSVLRRMVFPRPVAGAVVTVTQRARLTPPARE